MVKADPTLSHVKYPDISVRLVGEDGNAFAILGRVTRAMRRARLPKSEIDTFMQEATAGNYDALLCTVMRWVNCDPDDYSDYGE
jgi:hypothetical protein